ncbi:hypothetical protein [Methylobacterium sp. Leaf456]|uniref:hypothetical protein n=1 Tax=Methylobacterium sp. Leaf456 TaxID=1736382 RepID=UPI0012E3A9F6|nr:hypothetical protein [Methylobacterium sp. Leaf456]
MIIGRIKVIISGIRRRYLADKQNEEKFMQIERGMHPNASTFANSKFEGDYTTACAILRKQLNQIFPDSYHARTQAGYNPSHDYSASHSDAINDSSAAIARSLRAGDEIEQAVRLGALAIGLR